MDLEAEACWLRVPLATVHSPYEGDLQSIKGHRPDSLKTICSAGHIWAPPEGQMLFEAQDQKMLLNPHDPALRYTT